MAETGSLRAETLLEEKRLSPDLALDVGSILE